MYNGRMEVKFLGPTEEKPNRHMYFVEGKRKTGVTTFLGIKDKSAALTSWVREETIKAALPMLDTGAAIDLISLVRCVYASEDTKQKAADLGSQVHDWIESYIKHRLGHKDHKRMPEMPEDPAVQTGAASFLAWEADHKVKFLWSEKVLYSKKHDYIGKGDFAAKVDGIVCLCDIKTGNGMYNSVRAQTAAYAMADTEESKTKYGGRWAIRIAKETEKEYLTRMELKNRIRKAMGKEPQTVEPYQIFEAKFLDNEKSYMKRDFEAFLAHMTLYKWDAETDFWKEKNGKI